MRLTLLGTGTPAPSLRRHCSGYVLEIGDDVIVLDHGPGAHHRLLESGRKATDVTHAFFTHLHYDHCYDYGRLVLQRWDQGAGRIDELPVFGPAPIARMTGLLFDEDGVFGPDLAARTQCELSLDIYRNRGGLLPRRPPRPVVRELAPGDGVAGQGWAVRVGEAQHAQPYLTSLAYRFDAPEGSVCYAGDSGSVFRPIVDLARDVDVLIHMTHFQSGTEPSAAYAAGCGGHLDVARVAQEAGARTLVLTHMIEAIDRPGIRERIIVEMSRIYAGTIVWGEDLMVVPIKPDLSREID